MSIKARKTTTPATPATNAKRPRTDEDEEEDGNDSDMCRKNFPPATTKPAKTKPATTTKKGGKNSSVSSSSKSAIFYASDNDEDELDYQTDGGYETETATRRRKPVGGGGVAKGRRGKAKLEGKQGVVESMINRNQTAMASIEKQTLTGLLLLTNELAGAILQPGNGSEIDRIIELLREHRTHDEDDNSRQAMLASITRRDSLASVLKTLVLDGLDGSNDKTEEDIAIKRNLIQTGGAKGNSVTFLERIKMASGKLTTGDKLKISQEQEAAASAAAASYQRKPQQEEDDVVVDLLSGNESDHHPQPSEKRKKTDTPSPPPPAPLTAPTQKALAQRQPPQPPVPTPVVRKTAAAPAAAQDLQAQIAQLLEMQRQLDVQQRQDAPSPPPPAAATTFDEGNKEEVELPDEEPE